MTTNELKSYVNRILGNNMRLLLPSYWWKRAFGAVIDNTVSADSIKTINGESVIGEGDLRVGSSESVLFVSPLSEGKELTEDDKAINAESYRKIVDGFNDGHFYDVKIFVLYATVDASIIGNPALTDNVLKLMFMTPSAAWAILTVMKDGSATLEEGDVTGGGESCSCAEEVIFYAADNVRGYTLTAEEKAKNVEAYNKQYQAYHDKTPLNRIVCVRGDVTLFMPVTYFIPAISTNGTTLNVIKSAGLDEFYINVSYDGSATYSEKKGLDEALSTTSQNPVQNKVITSALNEKADKSQIPTKLSQLEKDIEIGASTTVDSELSETSENPVQNKVVYGLAVAVDKHTEQLEAYLNYTTQSITRIDEQIATKQDTITDLATIRSNAAKGATALQSVPSEYITESELNAKNYATATQLTAKQDTISDLATIRSNATLGSTAIQKVKTINGESITGEGNVDLFTKALYDELVENMLENEEVYAAAVNDLNTRMIEADSVLNSEVSAREALATDVQTLTDRVTSNEEVTATSYNNLNERIENNYQHGETTYATKTELLGEITDMTNSIVENEEVIAATLNDLLARIDALVTRVEQLDNA